MFIHMVILVQPLSQMDMCRYIQGETSTPTETEKGHYRHMIGNTTFEDGHIYQYEAYTSLPIPLPGGFHTYYMEVRTTEDDGHTHVIKGFTQPSKD
ncbi:hypothetical protein CSV63_10230 [Sporosarcina sp. P34]|nr:hypothetical protein CSV63_10230 [Sporosarcina sp. P34]PID24837.1 hypothetical protein CSV60_07975 [Sporosarcina sp. P7]